MHKSQLMIRAGIAVAAVAAAVGIAGCAAHTSAPDYDAKFAQMMKSSFHDKGIAKVAWLKQDATNAACSEAEGAPLPEATAAAIQSANLQTVKWPTDGNFIGDWKAGDKLAESGKGMTWKDKSTSSSKNGGSCYNCHQIRTSEISFGTIGPSLAHYGKARGVKDPSDPSSQAVVKYTWAKLWNSKSYNACSNMPRFGHAGILDEKQLKDIMALLLDPNSPVNQ